MFRLTSIVAMSLLVSPLALADGHGHGHGHHKHHAHYGEVERAYVQTPQPAPRYNSYDQRSTQGLLGGALGSAAGYEMSRGDPLGAGIGAAAGAWIGNGMSR
ncbi:hypothetical protein [Methylomonas albis]|uniref:Glycine zipper 2TM domain-containing protein n=1 Tax=Methylomonas albis TaxID=1854563 RepID=A0ABR9D5U2_9GAMM|nr:hypothetical protein [Methylomonas albis]MBD9357653.1 hypothetical protein [Methylomonas albis]CAD6880962.1 hypothetical protein [Methylomonas albis]